MSRPVPVPSPSSNSAQRLREIRGSQLSRPQWPWSPHGHRPASSSSSSLATPYVGSPSTGHSFLSTSIGHASWTPGQSGTSSHYGSTTEETASTRQWTFMAFEWNIEGVSALRDVIENSPSIENRGESSTSERSLTDEEETIHPALKEAPILGENRFMLEIGALNVGVSFKLLQQSPNETLQARTQLQESLDDHEPPTPTQPRETDSHTSGTSPTGIPTTSLSITSLTTLEEPATLMAAIKSHETSVGERGARSEWVWETWEQFTFRKNSEVWECPLPPLSTLLENPRISASDAFVLCIQIHMPSGPHFPQHPSAYYVPRDLLEGIENSLDNSHTGDVRFICLERLPQTNSPPGSTTAHSRAPSESSSFVHRPQLVRKRILFAHSDILKQRSEYFRTMLSSSFAESSQNLPPGERRVHDVVIEEADFVTMYWLLKWVYANWLLFKEEDDPRDAITAMGAGWSANWLSAESRNEWDITTMVPNSPTTEVMADNSSIGSTDSVVTAPRMPSKPPVSPIAPNARSNATRNNTSAGPQGPALGNTSQPSSASTLSATPSRRSAATSAASIPRNAHGSQYAANSTVSQPTTPATRKSTQAPRQSRPNRTAIHPATDPHPHPTPSPPPASALSIYLIAHRYGIRGLTSLAVEQTMNNVTPRTAFPLLLATQFFSELRALLEDYVVEHWNEVSTSEEFDVCCQEIAAGDWAAFEGGATLSALFRRLHRPAA